MGVAARVLRAAAADHPVLFDCIPWLSVDAAKALHLLYPPYSATQMTPLSALQDGPLNVREMACCSDRLFTKLSKAEEARVLRL